MISLNFFPYYCLSLISFSGELLYVDEFLKRKFGGFEAATAATETDNVLKRKVSLRKAWLHFSALIHFLATMAPYKTMQNDGELVCRT